LWPREAKLSQQAGEGNIAVLSGIQINTPPGGKANYFLPIQFDLLNNMGNLVESLSLEE
jgi:hypothetical protein